MRKLTYCVGSTIDGFIAAPDGGDPTGPGGFWPIAEDYVAHLSATYPEILPAPARAALGVTAEGTRFDTVLEGRRSYQVGLDMGVTDAYPHLRHLVFSRTLAESPDPAVELVGGDPVARVRELKEEDGKGIWLLGGGGLAASLYGEIDELIVKLAPVTVGSGTPLFGASAAFEPAAYALAECVPMETGGVFLTYTRKRGS
ncbi:dihydrofolate reductase [Streptomyces armeniacus]|uniref:Dihydrofolate reductase n=1 Tax=Streptomyces armeniacus TaxID=83291 RepID=A0A345XJE2_9ACTN|nr:dihydrofolate reductase family protein [Streptomyces armeniacus]AXK31758.1 dihydrofolate reductase [Streptomyces armeniacus]